MNSETRIETEYAEIASDIAALVARKQLAYGRAAEKVSKIMRILYPDGVPAKAFDSSLLVVRVLDKICRIATAQGNTDGMSESPWRDILGYSLLAISMDSENENGD